MKKAGIALLVLLAIAAAAYWGFKALGGNNTIQLGVMNQAPASLAGKTFRGIPQDKKLGETFQSIETLLSLHPGKKIHTIYLTEPAGKLDTMEVFVGLDLPFAPADLESKTFSEQRFILATITGNQWVMPSPERVKEKIQLFAQEQNLILSGIFIDKILNDSTIQVIAPVK